MIVSMNDFITRYNLKVGQSLEALHRACMQQQHAGVKVSWFERVRLRLMLIAQARLCVTIHDEIRFLVAEEDAYR